MSFHDRACVLVATGFGVGFIPSRLQERMRAAGFRPFWTGAGLLGTLLGLAFALLGFPLSGPAGMAALAGLTALAVYCGGEAEKALQRVDDPRIVIDEVAGFLCALFYLPLPLLAAADRWAVLAAAFILFRIFDVAKWPVRAVQDLPGGWGVVLDDVCAGLFANLLLQAAVRRFLLP